MKESLDSQSFSDNDVLSYMDVKFLSECVELKRNNVRQGIQKYRQLCCRGRYHSHQNFLHRVRSFFFISQRRELLRSFEMYAQSTRVWKKACQKYLKQL